MPRQLFDNINFIEPYKSFSFWQQEGSVIIENMEKSVDLLEASTKWRIGLITIVSGPTDFGKNCSHFEEFKSTISRLDMNTVNVIQMNFSRINNDDMQAFINKKIFNNLEFDLQLLVQLPYNSTIGSFSFNSFGMYNILPDNNNPLQPEMISKMKLSPDGEENLHKEFSIIFSSFYKCFDVIKKDQIRTIFDNKQDAFLESYKHSIAELNVTATNMVKNIIDWQKQWEEKMIVTVQGYQEQYDQKYKQLENDYQEKIIKLNNEKEEYKKRLDEERIRLEDEYKDKGLEQSAEYEKKLSALELEYTEKESKLSERQAEVEAKHSDVMKLTNREARRNMRTDLKKVLKERNSNFEITWGTRGIYYFVNSIAILILLALGFMEYQLLNLAAEQSSHWTAFTRQILLGLAVGAIIFFIVRWNNNWFQRRVAEEFRLKKLDLDIDRASWVVEMAMEWSSEKGGEIPILLLETLARGLFEDNAIQIANLHPIDSVAALLSSASGQAAINTSHFKANLKAAPPSPQAPAASSTPSSPPGQASPGNGS